MTCDRVAARLVASIRPAFAVAIVLVALFVNAVAVSRGYGQEALTNQGIIDMVKSGLSESVIIAKIRASSDRKFDTSTGELAKLKAAKVPDKVVEEMIASSAPPPPPGPGSPANPDIAHLTPAGPRPLKLVYGEMEGSWAPYAGSRREVVLASAKAQYRITDKQPVFVTSLAPGQWALVQLKPGKKDRNLPISRNSPWDYGGVTYRNGPDPKYRVELESTPGPNGTAQLRPKEPLKPGEYGLIAIYRGQVNMNEVFEFGVDD